MKPPIFIRFWKAFYLVLVCAACQKEMTWSNNVTTYAGGRTSGTLEGVTDSVYFAGPNNITIDRDLSLLVTDEGLHQLRKIMTSEEVVSIAGMTAGFTDGQGNEARFNNPRGVAQDGSGNIYVADRHNHCIRKIDPGGYVSTVAGDGDAGFADGTGEAARFNNPIGLAVDGGNNVYVADSYNNCIRKITPDGSVSTLAGQEGGFADGQGSAARFNDPVDVAVDGGGNVYVADRGNHCIRKVTPDGQVSTLAGNGIPGYAEGTGEAAQFDNPYGVASDKSGIVYVGDSYNHRIRKITPDGTVSTIAGDGTPGFADGPGVAAQFDEPRGVALDPGGDFLFVADRNNRRIRKIDLR